MKRSRLAGAVLGCILALPASAEVVLRGVEGEMATNVRAWLSIATLPADAEQALVEARHRRSGEQIRKALQPYGRYSPEIASSLRFEQDGWRAEYRITPGPQTEITGLDLVITGAGSGEPGLAEAAAGVRGQLLDAPLRHGEYEAAKQRLLAAAFARGYIDAEFSRTELRVDVPAAQARIDWALTTGPQYRFGPIRVLSDSLDEDLLQRYVWITPGDAFDTERLLGLRLRLSQLGYFDQVDVDVQRDALEGDRIPVEVATTDRKAQFFRFGVGFGSDTGPRFTGDVEFRRLNRRGHRLRNTLRLAEENSYVSGQYAIPAGREPGEQWALGLQFKQQRLGSSRSDSGQLSLTRNFIRGIQLWQSYVQYEKELFRLDGESRNTDLIIPGLSLTLHSTDSHLLPGSGYRLYGDVHGAAKALASSATFLQLTGNARTVTRLGSSWRLLLRGQIGYSLVDELSELPLSQRFFAGGDNSVRGYDYRSLAPRSDAGEVIGGRYLLSGSVELDWIFYGDWGAAVFIDTGGADNNREVELSRGVGLGLRRRTPVGMLRIDGAWPLDSADPSPTLHVALGAEL